jgi:hypothetical protein
MKTLVLRIGAGEKILLSTDEHLILDLLVVEIRQGKVKLSFRASDKIKISTIQQLKGETHGRKTRY